MATTLVAAAKGVHVGVATAGRGSSRAGRADGPAGTGRARRRTLALALVPVLALPLAACTSAEDEPTPQDAAAALAAALQDGDLAGVPLASDTSADPQTRLEEAFAPLGEATRTVTVEEVTVDEGGEGEADDRAHATLAWSWDLAPLLGAGAADPAPWEYTTDVELMPVAAAPAEGEDTTDAPPVWTARWSSEVLVPSLGAGDTLRTSRVVGERADVLGAGGQPIVTERDVVRFGVDKMNVPAAEQPEAARVLAEAVGIDVDAYTAKVAGAGEKAFVEAITLRADATDHDLDALARLPKVSAVPGTMELAPTRDFARPVLGRTGEATAEIVEESGGRVVAGDQTGLSGLQKQYDAQLSGTAGLVVEVVDDQGGAAEAYRQDPVDGTPLETTIDLALQTKAEQVLAGVASPSALVAVRPSTGEVLAVASGTAGEGFSTATLGKYAPGSTFKVASALAMLRTGMTPDTTVPCTPSITVDGRQFQNVPGYPAAALGDVPLRTAFANSCNTAMISTAGAVDQASLHAAAADLGLGVGWPDLGAPAFTGSVPADSTGTDHAASLIGQARVEASPLGMAVLAASVAAGHRVSPVLVRPADAAAPTDAATSGAASSDDTATEGATDGATDGPSGTADDASTAEVPESRLTADEAATLHSLMRSVVTDGSATVLADLPGEVGAKTGTAQYGDGSQAHAWMIAVQGDLAVAVFVEQGEYGSTTAGPLLRAFLG